MKRIIRIKSVHKYVGVGVYDYQPASVAVRLLTLTCKNFDIKCDVLKVDEESAKLCFRGNKETIREIINAFNIDKGRLFNIDVCLF